MRLKHIKLAGFKSFVDPTTVKLPSNLIGIVGPNGCGKSNIIDAVRWVMGEGSAKHLRGESMTDVIFNGSTQRKPVGQAAIELVFDNSDASLGGEYASYAEISIRREVNRDANSNYYLNGTKCRRKDIIDIFLGTGLGPRSYAIIEQGMISRIIEAKPEELRIYLEETAGISKYKERRKETESRIQNTQENLARLSDIRDELEKQLDRLKRQANAAERYKILKVEERLAKAQLYALQWKGFDQNRSEQAKLIQQQEITLEAKIAEIRSLDTQVEHSRELSHELTETFNDVQRRYYNIGNELTRTEQDIAHRRERANQLELDLQQIEQQWMEATSHISLDHAEINRIETELAVSEPELEVAKVTAEKSAQHFTLAEQAMHDWQAQWDNFNQKAALATQKAEVEQTKIQHSEQKLQTCEKRAAQIDTELAALDFGKLEEELDTLRLQASELNDNHAEKQENINQLASAIQQQRVRNEQTNQQLNSFRHSLQTTQGRKASLDALQQIALGTKDNTTVEWLTQTGLAENKRLAQLLQVDPGYEKAVETVLEKYLQAVCVDEIHPIFSLIEQLPKINVTLFGLSKQTVASEKTHLVALNAKIKTDYSLKNLLNGIYVVDTLVEAVKQLEQLGDNESIVTRDGVWLSRNWLRIAHEEDAKSGVLKREQELKQLAQEITELERNVAENEAVYAAGKEQLQLLEEQRDEQQQGLNALTRLAAERNSQVQIKDTRLQQQQDRFKVLGREKEECEIAIEEIGNILKQQRHEWQLALESIEFDVQQRNQLLQLRDITREELDKSRSKAQQDRDVMHQLDAKLKSLHTQLDSLRQALIRLEKQQVVLQERKSNLQQGLQESLDPITAIEQTLAQLLQQRLTVESELTTARKQLELHEQKVRELTGSRNEIDNSIQHIRSGLEKMRIDRQTLEVRCITLQEQITEAEFVLETLLTEMPSEANIKQWEENLIELDRKIQRLGPINLAAIEEYEAQAERKTYLDSQNNDLTEALETLLAAIAKIDRETRERLHETFEKVNANFQRLFPKVFGGGKAALELTGDDLLSAGVHLMAQPPGKRNSTIHLLSGGEKALTAIALVFSLFQLNPAPFCMLDEVDAPLDDFNVHRFCDLVKEMAQQVQFIVISHNKITIEMSHHLTGVTMQEPGVSRLVAVDVEEAMALAEA